ncbi:MAG: hypothetical protein ACOC2U_04050 [bacterium]
MGDHILPQVLLRGFKINNPKNKNNSVIRILTKDAVKQLKIVNAYQKEEFYTRFIETQLNRSFENKFGIIKELLKESIEKEKGRQIEFSMSRYMQLLKFFVVMWRRSDVQIEQMENMLKSVLDNKIIRENMMKEFKNKPTDEFISEKNEILKTGFYSKMIKETNNKDKTVLKMLNNYNPLIIYNTSDISFPLHNKYATVIQTNNSDEEYPLLSIQPITDRIFLLYFNKDKFVGPRDFLEKDKVKMDVLNVDSRQKIKSLINIYIITSANSVVIDDSNYSIVRKRLLTQTNEHKMALKNALRDFVKECGYRFSKDM